MATTKKPVTKKSTKVTKAPVKKTVAKKTTATKKVVPAKKTTAKRKPTKKASKSHYESFKVATDVPPFLSFKITQQTIYWVILSSVIIFFQLWIIRMQYDVVTILEEIESTF